jgi:membrane associated rhomboid family serine protease
MESVGERPYATIAAILVPAVLIIVRVAVPSITVYSLGGLIGPVGNHWWRYLAAPFIYPDLGYLFVASFAIAIFGVPVERRLGTIPTAILIVACGALGMLAADGIQTAFASSHSTLLAAGGNGIALGLLCTWGVLRAAEVRANPGEDVEVIGAAVAAAVLILIPLIDDYADVFAGLSGAVVGAACGLAAVMARRERRPG